MNTNPITNTQDVIDSRDVIERIDYLETDEEGLDETEATELASLRAFADEADGVDDWQYGATLVHEDYFENYARELAQELGLISSDYSWPVSHIDWSEAADALAVDYSQIDFDGVTYYVR